MNKLSTAESSSELLHRNWRDEEEIQTDEQFSVSRSIFLIGYDHCDKC